MKRKSRVAKKYLLDEKKTMLEQFGKKAPSSPSKKSRILICLKIPTCRMDFHFCQILL